MKTNALHCKSVEEKASIIYCTRCRRILGYIDETYTARLQNVRLVKFVPHNVIEKNGLLTALMSIHENFQKRKYPIDKFDSMDEPKTKKQRFEVVTVRRMLRFDDFEVQTNEQNEDIESDDSDTSLIPMNVSTNDEPTITASEYFRSFMGRTPDGSPDPFINSVEFNWSGSSTNSDEVDDEESVHDFNFYGGSPLRCSTRNSFITISSSPPASNMTRDADIVSISSNSDVEFSRDIRIIYSLAI